MTNIIAIIGGGISGTLTVLNCIKQCKKNTSILWFDSQNNFCQGYAYSIDNEYLLLNVRANNMSIFADEPNHFVNWLAKNQYQFKPQDFVPRKIFGNYVKSVFEELKNSNPFITITEIAEEVVSINKTDNGFELKTINRYLAQKLVLAFGNFLPAHPSSFSKEFISSSNYYQNAFDGNLMHEVLSKKNIVIIGSGLTMIDVVVSLYQHQFKGKIQVISPHAYIPQSHQEKPLPSVDPFIEPNKKYHLLELLTLVNQKIKLATKEGLSIHSIIDLMRPYLQFIWYNFSVEEKKQFLRHLRHKWGVARHRASVNSMLIFNELHSTKQLTLIKGRIFDINIDGEEFDINYSSSNLMHQCIKTDFIINCTGPESNYNKIPNQLVKYLITNRIIEPDPLFYGINSQKNGQIAKDIYTLGPPLKGILWESIAVPEIRLQAKELASKIICI